MNKRITFKVKLGIERNLGLFDQDKNDPINRLIPLSVITLSGAHCSRLCATRPCSCPPGYKMFGGLDSDKNYYHCFQIMVGRQLLYIQIINRQ
jgi:hypothetical protein